MLSKIEHGYFNSNAPPQKKDVLMAIGAIYLHIRIKSVIFAQKPFLCLVILDLLI